MQSLFEMVKTRRLRLAGHVLRQESQAYKRRHELDSGRWTKISTKTNKPFIGFWQPGKAGLNKQTEKSCIHNIHKITSLEMI